MAKLTIEELARVSGLTVRNLRNHQTRGILPGPQMEGRVGYYGEEHVERLRLIARLRDDGHSLKTIESLLLTRGETADRMNALRSYTLSQLPPMGEPERVTAEQARERFGEFSTQTVELALALKAVSLDEGGAFVVHDPALLAVLERATKEGLSIDGALTAAAGVQQWCQEAAETFVELIRRDIWQPFLDAGQPEQRWDEIAGAIDRARPLAGQIFLLMLPAAIDRQIEQAFGEEFSKQAAAAERFRRGEDARPRPN